MDMKDKIAKLLAKAERTDNPHEAQTFTEAAERLMIKWGIEAAELEAGGTVGAEEIVQVIRTARGSYKQALLTLATTTCNGMGGLNVLQSKRGNEIYVYIIGHKSDVERAEMLLNSLELQALSAMKTWWKSAPERHWLTSMESFKARRQFIISFGYEVGRRLQALRTEVVAEAQAGTALVLSDRKERVDEWMHSQHNVRKSRSRLHGSYAGRDEGRLAGRQANLGEKGVRGGRAAIH